MSADKDSAAAGAKPKARLFFALWPDAAAAKSLVDIAGEVAQIFGGRVTRQETVHLTLAFLGEVDVDSLEDVENSARLVSVVPFQLEFDHLEAWSRQRLCVARCACPPALAVLVERLRASLSAIGLGAMHGDYPFKPHVTLVRGMPLGHEAVSGAAERQSLDEHPASGSLDAIPARLFPVISPPAWMCEHFVLVRSRLSSSGSGYEVIAEFPLRG